MRDLGRFHVQPQPDDSTCGPTCLHAVYRYYGDEIPLEEVLSGTPMLSEGGTLGVLLGCHALERGYDATLYTTNLAVLDPSWTGLRPRALAAKVRERAEAKDDPKLTGACLAYERFLGSGGKVRFQEPTPALLRRILKRGTPALTGLSATFLYGSRRELADGREDDVRGEPVGHFVVLCGYDPARRSVVVADPLSPNPIAPERKYSVAIGRAIAAILLGVLTYDANLLAISPRGERS